jgi:hypothetical protein
MSYTLSTTPSEDPERIRTLLHANLLLVFNERNEATRKAAIATTYVEDIIWHEPDRVNIGYDAMNQRAEEILTEAPGFGFQMDSEMVVSQNVGVLNWKFGPKGTPDLIKGIDVIVVEGGKVKALWTAVTKVPEQ